MAFIDKAGVHWWALRTRANFEKKVHEQLTSKGIEAFLPSYERPSKRTDRKKTFSAPLFPGYLFCHTELANFDKRVAVLRTPGVVSIVSGPNGPEPIPDSQINSVITICQSKRFFEPLSQVEVGAPILIVHGALAGVSGVVSQVRGKGRRIVCNVDLLGRSVAAELDPDDLEIKPKE
jgi:transcription antitermination factor NusG